MTCRSSFRSGPGWFVGMNGSITAHCSSESQNRSAIAASMLQTAALNHKTITLATPWFGSHPSLVGLAHKNKVVVALAGKLARIAWAVLRSGGGYATRISQRVAA